jgi:hypothetical protein
MRAQIEREARISATGPSSIKAFLRVHLRSIHRKKYAGAGMFGGF